MGPSKETIEVMADKTVIANPSFGKFKPLSREDSIAIYKASL
ncbi:iron-containing alcohol dehydrogenase [Amphibacillus jilinensis]|nr:iron-containing alcohol dehydrogenase [Amphibacillus jilinensis]